MKSDSIFVIYSFFNLKIPMSGNIKKGLSLSNYYILNVFDKNREIDWDILTETFKDLFLDDCEIKGEGPLGPFDNLTSLNRFSFEVLKKLKAKTVHLLSAEEFNSIIERSSSACDFKKIIEGNSKKIENISQKRNSSIFQRFFK